jgi:hypothetical protein
MLEVPIRKIQILTDRETGLPLFYCHSADVDHNPVLSLEKVGAQVLIRARQMLYKVKWNPQRKNRVDIYMAVGEAHRLGEALVDVADSLKPIQWQASRANPHAAAKGNMQLPSIVWAKSSRYVRAAARVNSGIQMEARNGYINVDLEFPHQTHIKMKEHEVHIGVTLATPSGNHDASKSFPVNVPEEELQKGRKEKNPIFKVHGDFYLELSMDIAGGLGLLLRKSVEPEAM